MFTLLISNIVNLKIIVQFFLNKRLFSSKLNFEKLLPHALRNFRFAQYMLSYGHPVQ